MLDRRHLARAAIAFVLAGLALAPVGTVAQSPQVFEVTLDAGKPVSSGRLIIIAKPIDKATVIGGQLMPVFGGGPTGGNWVAAQDVGRIAPGETVRISADDIAFPQGFSKLSKGTYVVQALLDVDRNFAYKGFPSSADIASPPVRMDLPGAAPPITLVRQTPSMPPFAANNPANAAAKGAADAIEFQSPALTAFHGKPTFVRGFVLRPPGYEMGSQRYPTVYRTEGFGADLGSIASDFALVQVHQAMVSGQMPPMIWVFLDHSGPTGTHEFADSANNGPWGKALTEELIPHLEGRYRMDARPSGRFLTGHSSGGWMALWTQVRYPKLFGGTWPTAPDPVDFRDFTNVDIYAPGANAYRRADGGDVPLVRGNPPTPLRIYTAYELVGGDVGGQMASFDWVFSPKGRDGKPRPLFDRKTGAVDPEVARYWRDNYDIAHRIRTQWPQLKPDLDGKIHLIVGTADTYHLEGSARLLKHTLDSVGAKSDFRFVEGRNHGNLMADGRDPWALTKTIAWEMYAIARPGERRPQASIDTQSRMRQCGRVEPPVFASENFDPDSVERSPLPAGRVAVRDGQNRIAYFVDERGLAPPVMPKTPQFFRGSAGEVLGTLIRDPLCGDLVLTDPPADLPPGNLALRDPGGRWVVRSQPQSGDRSPFLPIRRR